MSVRIGENKVVITDHAVGDVSIVAEFRAAADAGKDLDAFTTTLLSLGAQVVALGSSTASAEKIEASISGARQAIQDVTVGVQDAIKRQVADLSAQDGSLVRSLTEIVAGFRDEIDEMTAGEESPLRTAMLKSLKEAQDRIQSDIARQVAQQKGELAGLLDPSAPTSPLRTLTEKLDSLGDAIARVQEAQVRELAVAEVVEAGVVGGLDYEQVVIDVVQRIAAVAGDDCEYTGSVTGRVSKSKKGDGVVDLKVGGTVHARVVLEAKNQRLSKLDWERECKGGKENRGATGFIGLCKHLEDMPNGSRLLILSNREIVLAFDPERDNADLLLMTYQLVKLNCLSATGQIDEVNVAEVATSLAEALKSLERFDNVTKQTSAIRNAAESIARDAAAIREAVRRHLADAQVAMGNRLAPLELGEVDLLAITDGEDGS